MPIRIEGAAENNLKNVNAEIGEGLTVVTGISGSGKTSLVFDVLYHEARRRFLDAFASPNSALRLPPAKVASISGLKPAVAAAQNLLNRNPNSILASASGLHPFLRILYARFGKRSCPNCGTELASSTNDEIVERLIALSSGSEISVTANILKAASGSHGTLLRLLEKKYGKGALVVDGKAWKGLRLDPGNPHSIGLVLPSLAKGSGPEKAREILDRAAGLGSESIFCVPDPAAKHGPAIELRRVPSCPGCGEWFEGIEPSIFHGKCPECGGSGCARCGDTGMRPEAASVRWESLCFPEFLALSVEEAFSLFLKAELPRSASRLKAEIEKRFEALATAGLGYVQLDRPSPSLSRGEAQRVRLALILTSGLYDILHILDEPTVGLHPADVARLMPAFRKLRGPVVFVEHDRAAAAWADDALDLGPGAGERGGRLIFSGTTDELWKADTLTGTCFSLRRRPALPKPRPEPDAFLLFRGASLRNLKGIDISIPLKRVCAVTGVSGSGKSTLVEDVIAASLTKGKPIGCSSVDGPMLEALAVDQSPIGLNPRSNPATYTGLAALIRDLFAAETGLNPSCFSFNRPEGACPSCGGMGSIEIAMKYLPSEWIPCTDCGGRRFSEKILAAKVYFAGESLSFADFLEKSIDEIPRLMDGGPKVGLAKGRKARRILEALIDVGLGYLSLGQASPSLSGGEAQRMKLARLLGSEDTGEKLLILDEPSTGLHPMDVERLLMTLDRLARAGATVIVVEHNTDIILASDWVLDLGPGSGPSGGSLLFAGPPSRLVSQADTPTAKALREEAGIGPGGRIKRQGIKSAESISIRGARANNLKNVSIDFPKGALSVVTGVSGSGKSSLVKDVLEIEARRRFLESLSMYERQGTSEGPEAPVDSVEGLGISASIGGERGVYERRSTVGTASELSLHLAVLLAFAGERDCPGCGKRMRRTNTGSGRRGAAGMEMRWVCPSCGKSAFAGEPRHFIPTNYAAACPACQGVGSVQVPAPSKLIIRPELPLLGGAMYSPGFFPKGYLGKEGNGGYDLLMALSARQGFDPFTTPWREMSEKAQEAFLFGDSELIPVRSSSPKGKGRIHNLRFPGFYGWIRDWDIGGTYTDTRTCGACGGSRLRAEYGEVSIQGAKVVSLNAMPLSKLENLLGSQKADRIDQQARQSLERAKRRLGFLVRIGLGYLSLDRPCASLSAGEAQRVRLAGLLGSGIGSLTVILDEPTRGMHPREVEALVEILRELRDEGNSVIVIEHEPLVIRSADFVADMGPGAGAEGGEILFKGSPEKLLESRKSLTAKWLRGEEYAGSDRAELEMPERGKPDPGKVLRIRGARGNNLRGGDVEIPLGLLVGVCGVSGSGKSTLIIDTLSRFLAPKKHTTSTAMEPIDPLPFDSIEGAPERTIVLDQAKGGMSSPVDFLGIADPLIGLYLRSPELRALGAVPGGFSRSCSSCRGRGSVKIDMGFLPAAESPCETCGGSGFSPEARRARIMGISLPELFAMGLEEAKTFLSSLPDPEELSAPLRALEAAVKLGLGYLALNQPGRSLSGGEAQRLKIVSELLSKKQTESNLFILDEPTVGQHMEDVERLTSALRSLRGGSRSVLVVEHNAQLLAACDWLIEMGPGGGPEGGLVIAEGPPETLAAGKTPIAPYLRGMLKAGRVS